MSCSESRLFQAVEEGDATTVRRLLSTGGQASTAARHPSHGGTVLHVAAGLVTLPVETQVRCSHDRHAPLPLNAHPELRYG